MSDPCLVPSSVGRALLAVLALSGLFAPKVTAATVKKVNKDKTRVLISLNKAEMAALEEDQEVVVEVGSSTDRFVVSGTLQKLNPVKQTVVLELEPGDPRFAKKQSILFLSVFWNPALAPEIESVGQYHQYPRPFAEAGAGYFFEELGSKVDAAGEKDKFVYAGTRFTALGYMVFIPRWFGATFGFERIDALQTAAYTVSDHTDELSSATSVTVLKPAGWVGLPDDYRLGIEYDVSLIHEARGSGSSQIGFDYTLAQPYFSVVHAAPDFEYGFGYKFRDQATAADTFTAGTLSFKVESVRKAPQELLGFFRSVSSPVFVWGLSGGAVIAERSNGPNAPLDRKFEIQETLRLRTTFENRLGDGSKLDWGLFYAGAKTPANGAPERGVNGGGLQLTYQTLFGGGILVGGTLELFGGLIRTRDRVQDTAGRDVGTVGRQTAGGAATALLFARMDFDFGLGKSGRRR